MLFYLLVDIVNLGEQPAAMQTSDAPMNILDNNSYNRFVVLVLSVCTTAAVTWSYLFISLQITFNIRLIIERDPSNGRCNGVTAKVQQRVREPKRTAKETERQLQAQCSMDLHHAMTKQSAKYYTYTGHGSKLQSNSTNDIISINSDAQALRTDCQDLYS